MSTWTNLYINTGNTIPVVEKLIDLTDDLVVIPDTDFPSDMGEYQMMDLERAPDYIAIGRTQPDWTTIVHNSSDKLEDWGLLFSEQLSCKVIVTMAQSVSDYYYFALFEKGEKLREIETCTSTDNFEGINYGKRFDFEGEEPGIKDTWEGEESYTFGFDAIEEYCRHFNLVIQTDYDATKWTVLKGKNLRKEVQEYVQRLLVKKPWWKFW